MVFKIISGKWKIPCMSQYKMNTICMLTPYFLASLFLCAGCQSQLYSAMHNNVITPYKLKYILYELSLQIFSLK